MVEDDDMRRKKKFICSNGPLRGHELWLTDGTTAYFTYRKQTGRYSDGKWEPWKPKQPEPELPEAA